MQMKIYAFDYVPPVFKRGRHVLLAIFSNDHTKIALSRKHAYPTGIYRLFGGGVEPQEEVIGAAVRELAEETGLHLDPSKFDHVDTYQFTIQETASSHTYHFFSDIFLVNPGNQPIIPADDVNEMKWFSKLELAELMTNYQALSTDLVSPRPGEQFRWSDWGKIFGFLHQEVLNRF